jgi:general secretion pathway protein D
VIGGLVRNVIGRTEEKVPVLGDIPVLGALFRKRTNQNEKRNLILVMTPYIIRSQQDLRTVFERKMQERQEYLDRYFVFSESSEYHPPKDWSRTNGLVEDIRQSYFKLDERKRLDEIARPKDIKTHDPQRPLEMPHNMRPAGGTTAPTPGPTPTPPPTPPAATPGGTPPVNVNPAVRNIEKIEK